REQIDAAAAALAEAGYEVDEAEPPRLDDALNAYGTLITAEFGRRWPSIRRLLTEESAQHMERSMARQPPAELDAYMDAIATRFGVMRDWARFTERYPLILAPVYTWRPFDVDPMDPEAGLKTVFGMRMCTASTFVGAPAVAVPTRVVDGQPLGVQLIGPRLREDACLVAAAELQRRFGVPTPVIDPRPAA
ncbi:MAG: amidase family protein, partial [Stackebrandtia sp.]